MLRTINYWAGKPVYIGVGERDMNLEVAKVSVDAYRGLGANVTFEIYAGLGHEADSHSKVLADWFLGSGPLKRAVADVAAARAAQAAGQAGKAYKQFKLAAAWEGRIPDLGATKAAEAIAAEAEAQLAAAEKALAEKHYTEAARTFAQAATAS